LSCLERGVLVPMSANEEKTETSPTDDQKKAENVGSTDVVEQLRKQLKELSEKVEAIEQKAK
jgi:hypothetical protein